MMAYLLNQTALAYQEKKHTSSEDFSSKREITRLLNKHSKVFEGIGRIRDNKNNKELFVKFSMKPDAALVAQKPRPVAYYLQTPFKTWLEQGIADDIFEEIPNREPVTWCSPMVVQPKLRFTNISKDDLKPNMIRACIDLRIPNKHREEPNITRTCCRRLHVQVLRLYNVF